MYQKNQRTIPRTNLKFFLKTGPNVQARTKMSSLAFILVTVATGSERYCL